MAHRRQKQFGGARIVGPPGITRVTVLVLAIVLAAILFGVSGRYHRTENVSGYLLNAHNTQRLYPERAGQLKVVLVHVGDTVNRGQKLATVVSALANQREHGTTQAEDIAEQLTQLELAETNFLANHALTLHRQSATLHALNQRQLLLQQQLALQTRKQAQTRQMRDASLPLMQRGQLSRLRYQDIETRWYSATENLAALQAQSADITAEQVLLQLELDNGDISRQAGLLPLQARQTELRQLRNQALRQSRQHLLAPVSGQITSLLRQPGETVAPGMAVMTITPMDSPLQARLMISASAIGFIEPGQSVNLLLDAFPHQHFGSLRGKIISVSRHPLTAADRQAGIDQGPPAYVATVGLDRQNVVAYGEQFPLREGMTLRADVQLESRDLLAWLLEPLRIMRGRQAS